MSFLFYRRPSYIPKSAGPLNGAECQKYVERAKVAEALIPKELSFENIMNKKTLPVWPPLAPPSLSNPSIHVEKHTQNNNTLTFQFNPQPCALEDFMDYLVYVARDAENLQFYLWLQDYTARFAAAPRSETCLSPALPTDPTGQDFSNPYKARFSEKTLESFGIEQITTHFEAINSIETLRADSISLASTQVASLKSLRSMKSPTVEGINQAGLVWEPFSIQPFRPEINRIIAHYILPSSPRELNLSYKDRSTLLHALQHTTHPSAFTPLLTTIDCHLRNVAHPNFIRWSICNSNKPRVWFLRALGSANFSLGCLIAIMLLLSDRPRWWRAFAMLLWWAGLTNLIAAYNGLCVLLNGLHKRELHPWELDQGDGLDISIEGESCDTIADAATLCPTDSNTTDASARRYQLGSREESTVGHILAAVQRAMSLSHLAPLGPPNNKFESEPWMQKWRRMGWVRKIKIKRVRVKEESLLVLQNRIVRGAMGWAAVGAVGLGGVFLILPIVGVF
ncbi:hypothetical protein MMC09_004248 [Bachmanniomyces sp. S44760]|nr:hypothetical protein [Bachmanniomyces sp. S44760]